MTAFSKTLRTVLELLGTNSERAARATMMLRSEVSALASGARPPNFEDVRRLAGMVPENQPDWKAALFHAFLEDEYGREWVELLMSPARNLRTPECAHSRGD